MSQVNGKYIKDENNNIISPITSTETIYYKDGYDNSGDSNKNLQSLFSDNIYYENSSSIKEVTFDNYIIKENTFYEYKISGTLDGDTGAASSVLITPLIGIPGASRVNFFGYINNQVSAVSNDNFNSGLMIARGITGNRFLYSGTIHLSSSGVLQNVANGGTVNGNDTLNIQIRTLLAGYSGSLTGFKLQASSSGNLRDSKFVMKRI